MDEWKGEQYGDEGNHQTEQWSKTEEWSTKAFHLLLWNQIYCWNLTMFLYSFIMKTASSLDGGAAIDGEKILYYCICLYLLTPVCKYRPICRWLIAVRAALDWWNTWPKDALDLNCHTLLWHRPRHAITGVTQCSRCSALKTFHRQKIYLQKQLMLVTCTVCWFLLFCPTKAHYAYIADNLFMVTLSTTSHCVTVFPLHTLTWHCVSPTDDIIQIISIRNHGALYVFGAKLVFWHKWLSCIKKAWCTSVMCFVAFPCNIYFDVHIFHFCKQPSF